MNEMISSVARRTFPYETSGSEEWVRFRCPEGRTRYVVRSRLADGYQAWCEHGGEIRPEWHQSAESAVEVLLGNRPTGLDGADSDQPSTGLAQAVGS